MHGLVANRVALERDRVARAVRGAAERPALADHLARHVGRLPAIDTDKEEVVVAEADVLVVRDGAEDCATYSHHGQPDALPPSRADCS